MPREITEAGLAKLFLKTKDDEDKIKSLTGDKKTRAIEKLRQDWAVYLRKSKLLRSKGHGGTRRHRRRGGSHHNTQRRRR
jgi:hypothetical protein